VGSSSATAEETIGFIGLGTMGGPMCAQLLGAGHTVVVYDRDPDALERAVAHGAAATDSARECARRCDVLMTSLPRPDHVHQVMCDDGALGALSPTALWVDLTTNRPVLIQSLAVDAPRGVDVVDAPVTGAVDGARHGRLTLFVGGEPRATTRARPILENLGLVIECGPLGSGNVVKLVTNQLWFVTAAAFGEGLATGMANGVDLGTLWGAIKASVGDSFVARHDAPSIFAGHYDPSFPLDLCLKDLGLLDELMDTVGADLPMTEAAHRTFRRAADRYGTDAGEMHVARRIEDDAGIEMRLAGDWTPPWEA
jgi:3-hydroxyisobutyrate dehydrogenase